jgi:hypothetical protein
MGVPMAQSAFDKALPVTTKGVPGRNATREEDRDCSGQYLVGSRITSQHARYSTPIDITPKILAALFPFLFGGYAGPTGTPANEEQTITIDATGGTLTYSFTFEGLTGTTAAVAWNATAAQLKAALEKLRSIKTGNVNVAKVGNVYTVTFTSKLANANVPLLVTNPAGLTGGASTAVVAPTVAGGQNTHAVTQQSSDQVVVTGFIAGYNDEDAGTPRQYSDMALNSVTMRVTRRQKATATLEWIGSWLVEAADGFVLPVCQLPAPIYSEDCRVTIDGTVVPGDDLDSAEFTASQNIIIGDTAFPFDGKDVYQLLHGDPTAAFRLSVYGNEDDDLYALAEAEAIVSFRFDFGRPGDRISIIAPRTQLRLTDNPISFVGDASMSAIQIEAIPFFDPDNAGTTPLNVIMYNDQAVAYLVAA